MAAAINSPGPKGIILLGALGIGVYWWMTRQAMAAPSRPLFPTPLQNKQYEAFSAKDTALWGTIGQILNKGVDTLFSPASTQPYYAANAAVAARERAEAAAGKSSYAPSGDPYNPDGFYSSGNDAYVGNPVGTSPWDEYGSSIGELGGWT
jgi:hypothetical protein